MFWNFDRYVGLNSIVFLFRQRTGLFISNVWEQYLILSFNLKLALETKNSGGLGLEIDHVVDLCMRDARSDIRDDRHMEIG